MANDSLSQTNEGDSRINDVQCTRRQALTLMGSGMIGCTAIIGTARAAPYDARVYRDSSDTWIAENGGAVVASGSDYINVIQAAVDSLTDGRTAKERVLVEDSGDTGPHSWDGDVKAIDLPSYTILDVPATINVNDTGDDLIIPIRAQDVSHIDIPRLNVTGNPRYGVWIKSCSDVYFGSVWMSLPTTSDVGIGLRIDDSGNNGRTTDVVLDYAYVEESKSHGVETYGVDRFDVGQVHTEYTGGCGLLLNNTADATVDTVVALEPDPNGGYAGFRCANHAGPNITVDHVTCRGGARGVFGVSGSYGITVESVHIVETDINGILIQDCQDVNINGGLVRNCYGEAVRIDSRASDRYYSASEVTVRDLRVADVRSNKQQTYGILETGPGTNNNHILDNDLRDAGTTADLDVYADNTEVRGNVLSGSTDLISSGRYRIENVNSGKVADVEAGSTADGANIFQWTYNGVANQHWDVTHLGEGEYEVRAVHSGKLMEVDAALIDDGANVQQWSSNSHPTQTWRIIDRGGGEYSVENAHSGKVTDVYGGSVEDGANIIQWPWRGSDNQRWTFHPT